MWAMHWMASGRGLLLQRLYGPDETPDATATTPHPLPRLPNSLSSIFLSTFRIFNNILTRERGASRRRMYRRGRSRSKQVRPDGYGNRHVMRYGVPWSEQLYLTPCTSSAPCCFLFSALRLGGRLVYITDYNHVTETGTIHLASTRPTLLHRYFPVHPRSTEVGQPSPPLNTLPRNNHFQNTGCLIFSHLIRASFGIPK